MSCACYFYILQKELTMARRPKVVNIDIDDVDVDEAPNVVVLSDDHESISDYIMRSSRSAPLAEVPLDRLIQRGERR